MIQKCPKCVKENKFCDHIESMRQNCTIGVLDVGRDSTHNVLDFPNALKALRSSFIWRTVV